MRMCFHLFGHLQKIAAHTAAQQEGLTTAKRRWDDPQRGSKEKQRMMRKALVATVAATAGACGGRS